MLVNERKISIKEKIGYSFGDLANNLVFQTLMIYLFYFYTHIYGLETLYAFAIILTVGLSHRAFGFSSIIAALADRTWLIDNPPGIHCSEFLVLACNGASGKKKPKN